MVRLLLTMGDPAGIGPEVLLRAISSRRLSVSITILGDLAWLKATARRFKMRIPWDRYRWIDLANVPPSLRLGRVQASAGRAAYSCLQEAVRLLRNSEADALVTAPISKEAIVKAGIPWVGHTEFLSSAFRSPTTMMFVTTLDQPGTGWKGVVRRPIAAATRRFRVSLVTTHLSLRRLPRALTKERLLGAIRLTREALLKDFGIHRPRIGLAALNPHAGEGGLFGEEEEKTLKPVARQLGGLVEGPLPVDSLMQAAAQGDYDAVVALYHDQALIPIKLLGWEGAVNVTLGLPFVRTSPVHGTAFDISGKGRASPASMRAAIDLATDLARRRA